MLEASVLSLDDALEDFESALNAIDTQPAGDASSGSAEQNPSKDNRLHIPFEDEGLAKRRRMMWYLHRSLPSIPKRLRLCSSPAGRKCAKVIGNQGPSLAPPSDEGATVF